MSLCFKEAFDQKQNGQIDEDRYLDHLLAHCKGAHHPDDDFRYESAEIWPLQEADLFGYSIWVWYRELDPVEDIVPLKNVFNAYKTGNLRDVEEKLALLPPDYGKAILESLALLSLHDQRVDVLKLCLDRGFEYQYYWTNAANEYEEENPDSEIATLLQQSEFRKFRPWPERSSSQETDPAEAFDEGGSYPVDW